MSNGYKYGYTGPPFNFLGHFSETQQAAFNSWVNERTKNFPALQLHYQIRAAQLRRTAGVLEAYYASQTGDEKLSPTFSKTTWQPGPNGWFGYLWRDDHLPMVAMYQIKDRLRDQFQRQDESVFQMNHLRNIIEKTEDKAQKASEATTQIANLLAKIDSFFQKPEYQAVLVKDRTDVYPAGTSQPRFRVHQLDVPTQYEQETSARQPQQDGPVSLKG